MVFSTDTSNYPIEDQNLGNRGNRDQNSTKNIDMVNSRKYTNFYQYSNNSGDLLKRAVHKQDFVLFNNFFTCFVRDECSQAFVN